MFFPVIFTFHLLLSLFAVAIFLLSQEVLVYVLGLCFYALARWIFTSLSVVAWMSYARFDIVVPIVPIDNCHCHADHYFRNWIFDLPTQSDFSEMTLLFLMEKTMLPLLSLFSLMLYKFLSFLPFLPLDPGKNPFSIFFFLIKSIFRSIQFFCKIHIFISFCKLKNTET